MNTPTRSCTSCDTPLPDGASYCPACGVATPTEISAQTGEVRSGLTLDANEAEYLERLQRALGENYELRQLIGRGGIGAVYAAWDVKLEREVAVKALRHDLFRTPALVERFEREARAVAKLRHPNILPIYTVGEGEGITFMVMPKIAGESLRAHLDREGQLSVDEAVRIASEAASGLQAAHDAGIVHRDIKPGNFLLEGKERRVLLMDFGIAKVAEGAEVGLTGTGTIVGTPLYMSPEQASGERRINHRSDIYSLGCVLYEMLAGDPPFAGSNMQAIIARHIGENPPSLSVVRPDLPSDLRRWVEKALAKVPADRPLSVGEFAEFVSGGAAWPEARASGSRIRRPRRLLVPVTAALAIVLGLGIAGKIGGLFDGTYSIHMRLPTAFGLSEQTGVYLEGMRVGEVQQVSPALSSASAALEFVATLALESKLPDGSILRLPRGTRALIGRPTWALGATVVELQLPAAAATTARLLLQSGDTILAERDTGLAEPGFAAVAESLRIALALTLQQVGQLRATFDSAARTGTSQKLLDSLESALRAAEAREAVILSGIDSTARSLAQADSLSADTVSQPGARQVAKTPVGQATQPSGGQLPRPPPPDIAGISVDQDQLFLRAGDSALVRARGLDSQGNALPNVEATWSSRDSSIATVAPVRGSPGSAVVGARGVGLVWVDVRVGDFSEIIPVVVQSRRDDSEASPSTCSGSWQVSVTNTRYPEQLEVYAHIREAGSPSIRRSYLGAVSGSRSRVFVVPGNVVLISTMDDIGRRRSFTPGRSFDLSVVFTCIPG